ncbi:MAG: hypothetical protein M0Z30_18830 [Actinomycetota bacterium]|nr:hypothetical protein [Actinomycetota bacterium]
MSTPTVMVGSEADGFEEAVVPVWCEELLHPANTPSKTTPASRRDR